MKKIVAVSMVAVLATTVFLSGCNTSKKMKVLQILIIAQPLLYHLM